MKKPRRETSAERAERLSTPEGIRAELDAAVRRGDLDVDPSSRWPGYPGDDGEPELPTPFRYPPPKTVSLYYPPGHRWVFREMGISTGDRAEWVSLFDGRRCGTVRKEGGKFIARSDYNNGPGAQEILDAFLDQHRTSFGATATEWGQGYNPHPRKEIKIVMVRDGTPFVTVIGADFHSMQQAIGGSSRIVQLSTLPVPFEAFTIWLDEGAQDAGAPVFFCLLIQMELFGNYFIARQGGGETQTESLTQEDTRQVIRAFGIRRYKGFQETR